LRGLTICEKLQKSDVRTQTIQYETSLSKKY